MNLVKILIFTVLLSLYSLSSFAFNPRIYITGDDKGFAVEDISLAIDKIIKNDKSKNILFYIHGRGKHPVKALKYLPDMETRYNIRIILFSWDSWINYITRPVKNAVMAAGELDIALNGLLDYRLMNPENFENKKVSFLSHSMGNIVLKSYLENYYSPNQLPPDFFDTFVLNAPDVALAGHYKWLNKLDFSPYIYSTYNRGDRVLLGSKIIDFTRLSFFKGPRLGKTIKFGFIKAKLAHKVKYLDFSGLTVFGHSHHRSSKKDSLFLNKIFSYLTNGLELPLDSSVGVSKIKGQLIKFKK